MTSIEFFFPSLYFVGIFYGVKILYVRAGYIFVSYVWTGSSGDRKRLELTVTLLFHMIIRTSNIFSAPRKHIFEQKG